ncbi:MAG: CBS domain-containing protein [Coleofasciculaceae cyanobacterium SM2_3_26]|nr:CBS domain-containing protein [Coleofasciculaceae cyanobacterium SM2_3_26]
MSEAIALMNQMQDRNPHWEGDRVWVVQAGQLVGELSRWDLLAWGAMTADPHIVPVAALMSRCPVAIEVIELGDAVRIVEILQIQAATAKNPCQLDLPTVLQPLPVVDDRRRLLGIVTPDRLWQILQPEDLLKLRQVLEVMDVEPIRVPPNLTVNDVARRMSEHRRTCVLVVPLPSPAHEGTDPDNTGTMMRLRSPRLGQEVGQWFASEPVGLLSDRDIRQLQLLGLDLSATPVGEVANFPPVTLSPSDSAWQAYQHMQQYRTDALAVEDCQGKHIGTVERDRLLQVARWERDRWQGGGGERRQNEQLAMKDFSLPQPSAPSPQSSEDLHTLTKEELIAELQTCREQWQGEQYLHHTAAQLLQQIETDWEHTKDRFQAVLDAVPGYISWIEAIAPEVEASPPELVYLGVNQRLADVFQLVPEDFVGQSIGFLSANHEFVRYVREFLPARWKTRLWKLQSKQWMALPKFTCSSPRNTPIKTRRFSSASTSLSASGWRRHSAAAPAPTAPCSMPCQT